MKKTLLVLFGIYSISVAFAAVDRILEGAKIKYPGGYTLTIPNAPDTLVGKSTTDSLTNKNFSKASNTFSGFTAGAFTIGDASGNLDSLASISNGKIPIGTGTTFAYAVPVSGSGITVQAGAGVLTISTTGGSSAKDVFIGSAQTANSTVTSASYADVSNQPTISFTATNTAKYKIWLTGTCTGATAGNVYYMKLVNTTGSPTENLIHEWAYIAQTNSVATECTAFTIASLTASTAYAWKIQMKGDSGATTLNNSLTAGGNAIIAEQLE